MYNTMMETVLIVGAGPSGLALAQIAASQGAQVTVLDRETEIGGAHRVRRVEHQGQYFFSEHSARLYSSTYLNFRMLLQRVNLDFFDFFVPYKFQLTTIGKLNVQSLSLRELMWFAWSVVRLIGNQDYGLRVSLQEFMQQHQFTAKAQDYLDRLARLTDGAGADRYSLNQFLQLINQYSFYRLYQPNQPNDIGLLPAWQTKLQEAGVVFQVQKTAVSIDSTTRTVTCADGSHFSADRIVLAIPPPDLVNLWSNGGDLREWADKTKYIDYLSFVLIWDEPLELPAVYGFPASDWGVAFIVLSDYFKNDGRGTLMSTVISFPDAVSTRLGKTPHQCTRREIGIEIWNQLRKVFPPDKFPMPTYIVPSPGDYFDAQTQKWTTRDVAYIRSAAEPRPLAFSSPTFPWLFNVGTHNGQSPLRLTTLESAVSNAVVLGHRLWPASKKTFPLTSPFTLTTLLVAALILFSVLVILLVQVL